MAPPVSGRVLTSGAKPSRRVACACPKCSTVFKPEMQGVFTCPRCGLVVELWMTEAAVRDRRPETAAASVAAAGEDQPSCVLHPENASSTACARCGDFICEVCRIAMEGRDFCPPCFERGIDKGELATVQRQFRQPQFALGIGALSIVGGCIFSYFSAFVGLIAVVMGIQALMKISKQPALGGRGKAIAGIVLGSIGFLLWVIAFAAFFLTMRQANRY